MGKGGGGRGILSDRSKTCNFSDREELRNAPPIDTFIFEIGI